MSIIRTALMGDLHVNIPRRSEEAFRIAYWIGEDARARGVHLIGIGGDLVDGPMTERERAKLIDLVVFYASIASVVINDGNHEVEFALRNALGKIPNVIVEDGADVHRIETDAGPIAVACVSFPKKAALLATVNDHRRREAEANKTEYRPVSGEEADQIAGQALQDVFRGIGTRLQTDDRFADMPCVALVHGTIKGSKVQPDDQPDRPLGLDIALIDLSLMGADFYNVPHVHLAQEWPIPNGNAWCATPSSPFYADFGEAKHFKGYILAEFDTDIVNVTPGDCATWQRIPTPATPMLLAEYEWNGEMFVRDGNQLHESDLDPKGADIRFRFRFPSDQRKAAVEAANGIAGLWRVDGALNVTLDPVQIPTTRSRIPALASTVRLDDKLELYWKAIGFEPTPERAAVLIEMLHELQDVAAAQGLAMGTVGRTAPSLKKVSLRGFLKYPDQVDLDFTTMTGPLTAIIAPNEEGKSLLMQLIGPGLMYGSTPTRGTLNDLSTAKDSFVTGQFSMAGANYTLTQSVNGKARTGMVSLTKDGKPELGNKSAGGRDDYKKWTDKNLLPQNVYDAVICQSGTESVIDMKDGPRVELLLRVLGLEIYEALAEMARKRTTSVSSELEGVRARIQEIGEVNLTPLRVNRDLLVVNESGQRLLLTAAEQALVSQRVASAEAEKKQSEYAALVARRDNLAAQVTALRTKRTQIQIRIEVGQELTSQKTEIEKAVADIATLEKEITTKPTGELERQLLKAQSEELQLLRERTALERRITEITEQDQQLVQRLNSLQTQMAEVRAVTTDGDFIRQAVNETAEYQAKLKAKWEDDNKQRVREAELAGELRDVRARWDNNAQAARELTRKLDAAQLVVGTNGYLKAQALAAVVAVKNLKTEIARKETTQSQYWAEIEALQLSVSTSSETRINGLRDGLTEISNGLAEPVAHAMKTLSADEDIEGESIENPGRLQEVRKQWGMLRDDLQDLRATLAIQQKDAARLPEIEAAENAITEALAALDVLDGIHTSLTEESNQVIAKQEALVSEMEQTQSDIRWLDTQISELAPLVARTELLATADTKLQGLAEQAVTITEDRVRLDRDISAVNKEIEDLAMAIADAGLLTESIRAKITANAESVAKLNKQIDALLSLASKSSFLAAAIAAEEELLHQISGVDNDLETAEHQHGTVERQVDGFTLPDPVDVSAYEQKVTDARTALTSIQTGLALAEKDLKEAEAKEGRRQELTAQVRGLEEKASNWTALGQHLGKDALQKEEISCAGPQLTEITNNLLRTAGDTRHTVSIETEKLHSNKKQMIPCLDIMVFDSVEQISKESRRLSDAGKILVGEPFSLALVVLGCQRAGIHSPTIFRDEATGVMDVTNSGFYIGMLRGFAEILDAHVLFISQNPAMWDLADSTIRISNGKIAVA